MDVDAEDPLPGYTPSSNFGNCALDGLASAYEKVRSNIWGKIKKNFRFVIAIFWLNGFMIIHL